MNVLTIVTYHYVRDIQHSRWPAIKALDEAHFIGQLDYLSRHYKFVTLEDCLQALEGTYTLPRNAVLLTFDDGYLDHYQTVFPHLKRRNISGAFFLPGCAIAERKLLWVNKFHFVLARVTDPRELLTAIFGILDECRKTSPIPSKEELTHGFTSTSRFDVWEIAFAKRLVQTILSIEIRHRVIQALYDRYVAEDERILADELYMTIAQAREMASKGMGLGSHAWSHERFTTLNREEQISEIEASLDFLHLLGVDTERWTLCYPYGSYTETTIDLLRSKSCRIGFTTKPDLAKLTADQALLLPRLDTNDLPFDAQTSPNHWTQAVLRDAEPVVPSRP